MAASSLTTDRHCRKPLCIRHITRQQTSGDYRFEVEWHTSAGIIKTVGWRWIRAHNRIVAPTCNGHHIFKLQPNVRASIRNLFTRLMSEDKNIDVPSIGGRKPSVTEFTKLSERQEENLPVASSLPDPKKRGEGNKFSLPLQEMGVTENHYGEMDVGMVPNVPAELVGRGDL